MSKKFRFALVLICVFVFTNVAYADSVAYRVHVANFGWQGWVTDGAVAGTTGRSRQMEAIQIDVPYNGIMYRAHVANRGWQNWVYDADTAGTTGQGRQMEAIQIRLTGNMAANYYVEYRVHVEGYGWLGWVSDGEVAGTTGRGLRMEAIQIRLIEKHRRRGRAPVRGYF